MVQYKYVYFRFLFDAKIHSVSAITLCTPLCLGDWWDPNSQSLT